jgi:NhaP-type Na+/H+ or K+/H+ antiporter
MLTIALLLFGSVLLALTLADRAVRRLPLTPALVYLVVGYGAGTLLGSPDSTAIAGHAPTLVVVTELAVLVSLFAVGLRLRVPPTWKAWRAAALLAGPGMVVTIGLGSVAAWALLDMPWPLALLLAAVMAPTDPVLASEVQIRTDTDRDAVRLSITAEGGLNDGTSLPAVMLALGLLGLHPLGAGWWWADLLWPIAGGAAIGSALGLLLGHALRWRLTRADRLARDELLYAGAVTLAFGIARAAQVSTFVVVFAVGVTLLLPLRRLDEHADEKDLAARLADFGGRCERLVEAGMVLAVGFVLHGLQPGWDTLAFAAVLVGVVRPLSVLAVIRGTAMTRHQRRLVAWFGIRGIGSLFYAAFALERGVAGAAAADLLAAVLVAVALSITLHGFSATPLMAAHQRRRRAPRLPPP